MKNATENLINLFLPFAQINENGEIVGFADDITEKAKEAAREYLEICQKFDDVSNIEYWEKQKQMLDK